MRMMINCRSLTIFLIRIPWCALGTCFTSHVIWIPNRSVLLTNAEIAVSWVFLTISWYIIVDSARWTSLALIRCWIPVRTCFITVDVNALVWMKIKYLFLWTCLICFYATLVFMVPLLTKRTVWNTILINYWPFMI